MFESHNTITLDVIEDKLLRSKDITLSILRLDKTDADIAGNKWFKLKYNLIEAKKQKHDTLLSFGGAFSNHLHALAAAAHQYHFRSIGVIRGEEQLPLNPTLSDAAGFGMQLHYLDRVTYRAKDSAEVLDKLEQRFGRFYLLPEGGTNQLALKGAAEIVDLLPEKYDYLCLPCGTGGTIAGILQGITGEAQILGFPALKQADFLAAQIETLSGVKQSERWRLVKGYDFGGFAKMRPELAGFIHRFESKFKIPLDPVYTAKMMYAIFDLLKKDIFPRGSDIIALHTGGLQGRRGMMYKLNHFS